MPACRAGRGCALEFLIAGIATWLMVRAGATDLYLPFVQEPVPTSAGSISRSAPSSSSPSAMR